MATPNARKIMIIRHAEKPDDSSADQGVDAQGQADDESLIVRGWQRAGALAVLFSPSRGPLQDANLATPGYLFASMVAKQSKSERPAETITPLSQKLNLTIDTRFAKDQVTEVAAAALASPATVLICWQHELIPAIANAIPTGSPVPQQWPGERFDLVWVFDLLPGGELYRFSQVPQRVLAGDGATVID